MSDITPIISKKTSASAIKIPIKKVTIIGAGWLGSALAFHFLKKGFDVIATKQTDAGIVDLQARIEDAQDALMASDKKSILQQLQLVTFTEIDLLNDGSKEKLKTLFTDRSIIITIPPTPFINGTEKMLAENKAPLCYEKMITQIAQMASQYGAREVLYTSSTSVYGDSSGTIHEAIPPMPKTLSAKAIRSAESALEVIAIERHLPITILRLGGLIGNGRHPVYVLSGRENISKPFDAINLIHINDLLLAIDALLLRATEIEIPIFSIYNVVTPYHPNRQSYYQAIAKHLQLSIPQFESPAPILKRIIDGSKITEAGDFTYREIDLISAPLDKIL